MQRKVNEIRNNIFDTNEILWLLEDNEDMSAPFWKWNLKTFQMCLKIMIWTEVQGMGHVIMAAGAGDKTAYRGSSAI